MKTVGDFCRYQQADSKGTRIAKQFWKRRNKFLEPHYPISGLTIKWRKSRKCGIGEEYTYRSMEQNREPRNSPWQIVNLFVTNM